LWATAVGRPALADAPAKPREPYGVAELFRQCLESARTFDAREGKAGRRLGWTVLGSVGLLALLGLLALGILAANSGQGPSALERSVDEYRVRAQARSPARTPQDLDQNLARLKSFQKDKAFAELPKEKQDYVGEQINKLTTFRALEEKLGQVLSPRLATSERQLQDIEDSLDQIKRKVPKEYRAEWDATQFGKLAEELPNEVKVLRRATAGAEEWYRRLYGKGKDILAHKQDEDFPLVKRARELFKEANNPPFPENTPDLALPGAPHVTYQTVYHFANVSEARARWEEIRAVLKPLAD
jgi:hypothetical protein